MTAIRDPAVVTHSVKAKEPVKSLIKACRVLCCAVQY